MRPLRSILTTISLLLLPFVQADISFSSPPAGQVISGSTITVEFADGAGTPPISQFTSYTLQLCAGGNAEGSYIPLVTFTNAGNPAASSYTATLTDLSVGAPTTNAYFLRTLGVVPGGTVINFSDRFTLSGMTGQFSPAVLAGLKTVSGTTGPATQNQVVSPQNPGAAAPAAGGAGAAGDPKFNVPYTMQMGPIRFAPMPKKAPTKITVKGGPSAQYPTSAWTAWSRSGMPRPDATQTQTDVFTFSVASTYATMAAQSQPRDDMQKFLNRWKD